MATTVADQETRTNGSHKRNGRIPEAAFAGLKASGVARLGELEARWELVTPGLAQKYLEANGRNRRFMEGLSLRYAEDMKLEQWLTTHQGIAFNREGELVDGQHRLGGIVTSGSPQWLLVTRGLSADAIEVLDRGRLRSLAHAMQIMGHDLGNSRVIAVARSMIQGENHRKGASLTDITRRKFIDHEREALLFACEAIPHSLAPAPVTAAVARAYHHAELAKLERFGLALADRIEVADMRPGDKTARVLARAIQIARSQGGGGSSSARISMYRKTQNALRYFLAGEDLSSNALRESTDDLYPLPEGALAVLGVKKGVREDAENGFASGDAED